ncbi:MAG: cupin domain-containing protein [Pseudomonadota bacterium]
MGTCQPNGTSHSPGIESLLFPTLSVQTFLDRYYEKEPLHVYDQNAERFLELFSIAAAEELLWQQKKHLPDFSQVFGVTDSALPAAKVNALLGNKEYQDWIIQQYCQGSTLRLNFIGGFWRPIANMERQFSALFPWIKPPKTIAYLTPGHTQGLAEHFDAQDVFVLQIQGSKKWSLADARTALPLSQRCPGTLGNESKSWREITLRPGDVLYIPRGVTHKAHTAGEASLHLTLAFIPILSADVMKEAIDAAEQADASLLQSVETLSDLPCLQLQTDIQTLLRRHHQERAELGDVQNRVKKSLIVSLKSLPDHNLNASQKCDVSPTDWIEKRCGQVSLVERDEDRAWITFPRQSSLGQLRSEFPDSVFGPLSIEPALRFIASQNKPFRVDAMPGALSDSSKAVLAKRLLREGLLKSAKPPVNANLKSSGSNQSLVAQLLSPFAIETFKTHHFERDVLHITERSKGAYIAGFSRQVGEDLLWKHENEILHIVEMLGGTNSTLSTDRLSGLLFGGEYRSWVYANYELGTSFRIKHLGLRDKQIAQLERQLIEDFLLRKPVSTDAIFAPAHSLRVNDSPLVDDILVLQIEGTQSWKVKKVEIPLHAHAVQAVSRLQPEQGQVREFKLEERDVLYIPRGFTQSRQAGPEGSIHLAIQLPVLRRTDLWKTAVDMASETDLAIRRSVGPGFSLEANQATSWLLERLGLEISEKELIERVQQKSSKELVSLPSTRLSSAST